LKIALFGLTGLGNAVLRALIAADLPPVLVISREENGEFPYYQERNILQEAKAANIPVAIGSTGESIVKSERWDLILVCTYHRILRKDVLQSASYAINLHPSLLPGYRGASPFYWVIRRGESKTGITAHYMTEDADRGDILLQEEAAIGANETQGTLRIKLAQTANSVTKALLRKINEQNLCGQQQDELKATSFPRVTDAVREIDMTWDQMTLRRHIAGLSPFPGALHHGEVISLDEALERFSEIAEQD
jgi:methionyl-tRNA formyltransferase